MVDSDYKKNKVTVCAHLQNIYNSFNVRRGRPMPTQDNYFDLEKWNLKLNSGKNDGEKDKMNQSLRRQETMPGNLRDEKDQREYNPNMILLSKSNSTHHIPENVRAKNSKRFYANFDKDLAGKMFGYRVLF